MLARGSGSPQLVCGCGPCHRKWPHVAVAWRAAALDAMPDVWHSAATVLSAHSCGLHYEATRIVGLVPCEPLMPPDRLGTLIEGWHRRISYDIGPVSAGRSSAHTGHAGLAQARCEALRALQVGERVRGPGCLTAYSDVFVLDYAAALASDSGLGELYDRVPSRLRTLDAGGAELLQTLETFLAEGSVHGTGVLLGIHRNTVLYRLKKIEDITGIDLEDSETRFLVHLTVRAHRWLATDSAPAHPGPATEPYDADHGRSAPARNR
jgi:hypothetical protein